MAKITKKLSPNKLKTLPPGLHNDGDGLYLSVTKLGSRSWVFRFSFNGKTRDMGIGSITRISLADARQLAKDASVKLKAGIDPIESRKGTKPEKKLTFRHCTIQYIAANKRKWTSKDHAKRWEDSLYNQAFPIIGNKSVDEIDTPLICRLIDPLWQRAPNSAHRLILRIEKILDWAKVRNLRKGDNPAKWKGHLDQVYTKAKRIEHHPALPYKELPEFFRSLKQKAGIAPLAIQFLILNASRSKEVLQAEWNEIDGTTWTIPPRRMKSGKEHKIPLTSQALTIIETMRTIRTNEYIFPSKEGTFSEEALRAVLKRMKRTDITIHGFRSTFKDWCAEQTDFPNEVSEQALAHQIPSATERAYRRTDLYEKRQELMKQWADYISK